MEQPQKEQIMTELKPCPFCGGKASIRTVPSGLTKGHIRNCFFVMCNQCLTSSNNYNSTILAADHWNRRISDE